MKPSTRKHSSVIEAAGGILWKDTAKGLKLAIIHRERYDDWSLPKGKREPGEKWEDTALREVCEETGCQAKIGSFIGSCSYVINRQRTPKIVLFWQMTVIKDNGFQPNSEVDKLKWISPKKAMKKLSYVDEREIVMLAIKKLRDQEK
jgi:8-oxo-dGTP diphosphatase